MAFDPLRGRRSLRLGRESLPGATYFLTICTDRKLPGLTAVMVGQCLSREWHAMQADGSWTLRSATIMPDHAHVIVTLGQRLTLGQCVGRLKGRTARALRTADEDLAWERDFFERRLRLEDDLPRLFLYVFMNPYRDQLCATDKRWPWYYCSPDDWNWLQDHLDKDLPPPEWLM